MPVDSTVPGGQGLLRTSHVTSSAHRRFISLVLTWPRKIGRPPREIVHVSSSACGSPTSPAVTSTGPQAKQPSNIFDCGRNRGLARSMSHAERSLPIV